MPVGLDRVEKVFGISNDEFEKGFAEKWVGYFEDEETGESSTEVVKGLRKSSYGKFED